MPGENHIIGVPYSASGLTRTRSVYQYDYGQVLSLDGFPEGMLPETFEMHFATEGGWSVTVLGQDGRVSVPDACLRKWQTVKAWLFLHDTENDGETRYAVEIPVRPRAQVMAQSPAPVLQDAVTRAVAALNAAVARTGDSLAAAEAARDEAEAAASMAAASSAEAARAAAAEAEKTGKEISALKSRISVLPLISESGVRDPDLDIADAGGNVLARFSGGHIFTKNFDSSGIYRATDNASADFDISDPYGNVILRLKDGHIQTGGFNSETDTRRWAGKIWTVIGDSLSRAPSRTARHYHEYIAERTGITVVNLAQSEGGYYAKPGDRTFRKQAELIPARSDVITVFGSGNDVQQIAAGTIPLGSAADTEPSTVCGCVNITIGNIFARSPLANLGMILPTPWYKTDGNTDWTPGNPGNVMETYCAALTEICRRRSVPFLDLYHGSGLRPADPAFRAAAYSRDGGGGIHPDERGHILIAAKIRAFLDSLLYC